MDELATGQVEALWRYPAKSMMGSPVETVAIDARGVIGDRSWATRDEERGGIRGAKKIAGLMGLSARYVDAAAPTAQRRSPPIVITLPDGAEVRSDDPDVDARVSAALGHRVTLHPLHDPTDLDHFRRGGPDTEDIERELRDVFGRTDEEPLPDLTPFLHVMEFESPPGSYVDAYPVSVLSTTTLAALAAATEGPDADVRRIRPNVVVALDAPDGHHPEAAWTGAVVRLGEVELEVVAPSARCVMVTRPFADLPENQPLLRTIVRDFDQNLGIYTNVRTPGVVRVGDPVTVTRV